MISEVEYKEAVKRHEDAERIIQQYHKEKQESFIERMKNNSVFTDEELRYSRESLCPCGHGLAYPKGCGVQHYWDCSAILKGIADKNVKHTDRLPFAFYEIESEDETPGDNRTTRGVFKPKAGAN